MTPVTNEQFFEAIGTGRCRMLLAALHLDAGASRKTAAGHAGLRRAQVTRGKLKELLAILQKQSALEKRDAMAALNRWVNGKHQSPVMDISRAF